MSEPAAGDWSPTRRAGWRRSASATALAAAVLTTFYVWSYRDCVANFFHYDDFWALAAAHSIHLSSPLDVVQFFKPIHGFVLYRPLSTVLYFYLLHAFFGYDPAGYHGVQIAFHVLNALLTYAIADALFFSRPLALLTALLYAAAPGHALAVCWTALFTMTGTAFFYLLALWVWLRLDSGWRVPITLGLFVVALLAGEHAVSLPLALTMSELLMRPDRRWRRLLTEQAPFYLISAFYAAAKLYYFRYRLADAFPSVAEQAYVRAGYGISLDPVSALRNLGRYVGFGLNLVYLVPAPELWALALGAAVAVAAVAMTLLVLMGRWTARALRVAAFGLDLFVLALAPVLFLPAHLYSYYVGIAALGLAVALVGLARSLPGVGRMAPWVVAGLVLATHVVATADLVRRSEEFRFLNSFTRSAASWLYTLSVVRDHERVEDVVVPRDGLTNMVFDVGHAHQVLLCADYGVHTTKEIGAVKPALGQIVIPQPLPLPDARGPAGPWAWMDRACARARPTGRTEEP